MGRLAAVILTSMSCFACGVSKSPGTPLGGSAACESMSCGSGQICVVQVSGIDAGAGGDFATCFTVPDGCAVFDCRGRDCPACLTDNCSLGAELADLVTVQGRTLTCPGE